MESNISDIIKAVKDYNKKLIPPENNDNEDMTEIKPEPKPRKKSQREIFVLNNINKK